MPVIVTVSTPEDLLLALKNAQGGEVIQLEGGNYGELQLAARTRINLDFPSNVTITAADPDNPPVFSGLDVRGVSNLTFDGITFDYQSVPGAPIYYKPFQVINSTNVTIRNSVFDGDVASGVGPEADGFGTGYALYIRTSSGVTVSDNVVTNFARGLIFSGGNDYTVTGNDISALRVDGMNFNTVSNVLIDGNYIHDFIRSPTAGDHSDMIQFWTTNSTRPSTDVVISNNILDVGDGGTTQSIFMRNEQVDKGLAGTEMYYQNITITGNVIVNGHLHGITLGAANGVNISNNTLLANSDSSSSIQIPRISVSPLSTDVAITGNATSAIAGFNGQSDWDVSLNAIIQNYDAFKAGYYGDVFINSTLQLDENGRHVYIGRPGGLLDQLGAGAPESRGGTADPDAGLEAEFLVMSPVTGGQTRIFDASVSFGTLPEGTSYTWTFGDGTTATGARVVHRYDDGGTYTVRLDVMLPNGTSDSNSLDLKIDSTDILYLNSQGEFVVNVAGVETQLPVRDGGNTGLPGTGEGVGVDLGGQGVVASVSTSYLRSLFGTPDVAMDLTLSGDTVGGSGEIMRLQGSMILSVNSKGQAYLRVWSSEGGFVGLTSSAKINDGQSHDVSMVLHDGRLELWVDDVVSASTDFAGTIAVASGSAFIFGNPWGQTAFDSTLEDFRLVVNGRSAEVNGADFTALQRGASDLALLAAVPEEGGQLAAAHDGWIDAVCEGHGHIELGDSAFEEIVGALSDPYDPLSAPEWADTFSSHQMIDISPPLA